MSLKRLRIRLTDLCFNNKLHHLGSYFGALPIIYDIYKHIKDKDIFILSNGHASVALYTVLEDRYGLDAQEMINTFGDHPKRSLPHRIFCSTGSLGMGITVSTGFALADSTRDVHVVISDGECAEGSVWEALRFKEEKSLSNLKVYVNANGFCAYDEVNVDLLEKRIHSFCEDVRFIRTNSSALPCLKGLEAHYKCMDESDYIKAIRYIEANNK
jgi:transketolase|tara:strand:- start:12690 stop:13331 length:642 start_codon:yes stop_codon:yes gene_type:complete